jgi:tetratricopeptide (TPR) repeat protein
VTDKRDPGDKKLGLDGVDWEDALAEWEEKTFLPEVAKDRETQTPGSLQGTPIPPPLSSKPLYVPPPESKPGSTARPPPSGPPKGSAPVPPIHRSPLPTRPEGDDEEEAGATVVAAIPRELLRKGSEVPARSSGGGLGQMFARPGTDRPSSDAAGDEDLENAPTATRTPAPPSAEDAVFTSAKEMELRGSAAMSDAPKRPRGPRLDPHASLREGEMFDPFAEPDPFQAPVLSPGAIPVIEGTPASSLEVHPAADGARSPHTTPSPPEASPAGVPVDVSPGPALHQPTKRAFDPDLDTSIHLKGALHAPARREYDPNEETSVLSKAAFRAHLAEPPDDEGEDLTRFRGRGSAHKQTQSWDDERPASELLPEAMRASFATRAEWLEAEGRASDDRSARARALLVASELRAMLGEIEAAEILAREAAATAPQMAMSPRQARALAPTPREAAPLAEALDAEARQSPTHAAKVHDALLAADVLRLAGDADGAAKRWDQAVRVAPSDPRAPLARAAERLARRDLSHGALRLPDAPELAPIGEAVARALKIRGVAHPDVATDEPLANDALRRARQAISTGDLGVAAAAVAELARVPELRDAASWLAAMLGAVAPATRGESVDWLRVVATKSAPARRALAARALELGAGEVVEEACRSGSAEGFSAADRGVLAFLAGVPQASSDEDLDSLGESPDLRPLGAALAAVGAPKGRAERAAGTARTRDTVRLARLLAAGAPSEAIDQALAPFDGDHDGETRAVALEMALRAGRYGDVSDAIAGWADDDEDGARDRSLAAALVAERAGDGARATAAYTSARAFDPANEAALRALVALDPRCDAGAELRSLGDARGEGPWAAMAWLEAVARGGPEQDEGLRNGLLEAAHRAAPTIPIAAFLAERSARRAGDVDAVLRWIRERRAATAATPDAVLGALDDVVEALLIADRDPALATERLAEAHRARPDDIPLRELYERVALEPPSDRATWRERRAATARAPATKARLLLEAAHEHERTGDSAAALRDAAAAHDAVGDGLARLALERAEIESGSAARLADGLLALARSTDDPRERREAYERLADLDATGRDDYASALLWHRTILEEEPHHLPSLRNVEHALLSDGRLDELEPTAASIARALVAAGDTSAETGAHAQLAARLRMRGAAGEWEPTRAITELAASLPEPSLWSLRALCAHARAANDEDALIRGSLALADRTTRSPEIAAIVLRAGEAAMRAEDLPRARELLERAATEDPGDVVTWGLLAEVRQQAADPRGAAEACESLARTSVVDEHRLLAWYDAGRLWLDEVDDEDRGVSALEQAGAIDLSFQDLFARLSALYTKRGNRAELAGLLERRLATATDDDDRVNLEIDRAQALISVGEPLAARRALESALETKADHAGALSALAALCATLHDWEAAEQAWVRLTRLVPDANDQRLVYERLGELYSEHAVNLSRAEVALKEVLKRAPDDIPTLERLVSVYRRLGDGPRALETAQHLLKMATQPEERRRRLVDIASIHETTTRELRKAEQALEGARREFPNDVGALRALAEFYQRQKQLPAVNILLDRASADARRALAAGRFSPVLFEVLQAVHELRGKRDAARVAAAVMAALDGHPANLPGAGGRAGDPRLDDLLAPEALTASLRALLLRAGDALDVASSLDLRALHAQPLAPGVAQSRVAAIASSLGIPPVQVLTSPQLGRTCVPSASGPPSVVVGEPLVAVMAEPAAAFVVTRALKLVQAHASALVRTPPAELAVLVAAWLQAHNASWTPQGVAPGALADAKRRVQAGLPRHPDSDLGTIALEVAGTLGPHLATLGASTIAWADRAALLSVGDPTAALDGVAWSLGMNDGAPRDPDRRAAWVLRTAEVRDLLVFAVSDAFAEARVRSGVSG